MPTVTGGGASNISSDQITDETIANVDVAVNAGIEQHKIEPSQMDNTDLIAFESTDGVSHSLTTVAGQRVLVRVTGNVNVTNAVATVTVLDNGVSKQTVNAGGTGAGGSQRAGFAMEYTELRGAVTANITVTTSIGSIENCIITVTKLMADA